MKSRENDKPSNFYRFGVPMALGAGANMISTYLTLPLQYIFTQRQLHPEKSYQTIARYSFSLKGMAEIYTQSGRAIRMAPFQSIAYLGVSLTALDYFHDDNLVIRGMKAGILSGSAESLVTANVSQKIVSSWNHAYLENLDKKMIFKRSLQATFLKNLVANPVTLISYSYALEQFNQRAGSNSPVNSAIAGMISALFAAPIIAPFSTLQTRTQNDPSLTLHQHAKKVLGESMMLFWKGGAGRAVYKVTDGMIKFGLVGLGRQAIERYREEEKKLSLKK